jgi:acetylornithine deacetylase/succinyl-diaminopimelate desuccinylase-like protein
MTVVNDVKSNGTYWKNGVLVYFEGNNVLAKIEGTVPSLDPVLLDAHFDSVATGAGKL